MTKTNGRIRRKSKINDEEKKKEKNQPVEKMNVSFWFQDDPNVA